MNEHPDRPVSLIALFRRSARLMVDDLVQRLAAAGYDDLPPAYHPVFENLDRGGTRLTVLAERAGMTHQSMGELVRTLVSRGYVERAPDPADARARLVVLTDKGRRMTRVAIREIASIQDEWLRRLAGVESPDGLVGALQVAVEELDGPRPAGDGSVGPPLTSEPPADKASGSSRGRAGTAFVGDCAGIHGRRD